jgi:F0F1-type ATP synthase delta subunit
VEPKPVQQPAPVEAQPRTPKHAASVHHGKQVRVEAKPEATPVATVDVPADDTPQSSDMILPEVVVSKTHISRALREVESIDDFFHQAAIRGSENQELPSVSKVLESIATSNQLNILQPQDRDKIKSFLSRLKTKAPVVHMSFPSEASDDFLGKLLRWYRKEAHPYTVIHVGLQPELAAGCTVRTTNKVHDFSFRKRFEKSKAKLIASLEEKTVKAPKPSAEPVVATATPAPVAEVASE